MRVLTGALTICLLLLAGCSDETRGDDLYREELIQRIKSNNTYVELYVRTTSGFCSDGDKRELASAYDGALKNIEGSREFILLLHGYDLCLLGDFDKAAPLLAQSIEVGEGQIEALALYYVCMLETGNVEVANKLRESWEKRREDFKFYENAVFDVISGDSEGHTEKEFLFHETAFLERLRSFSVLN